MKTKSERSLEDAFVLRIKDRGGVCIKLLGYKGITDRLAILPHGRVTFVELKREDGILSDAQLAWHDRLRARGHHVAVISNMETLDMFFPKGKPAKMCKCCNVYPAETNKGYCRSCDLDLTATGSI